MRVCAYQTFVAERYDFQDYYQIVWQVFILCAVPSPSFFVLYVEVSIQKALYVSSQLLKIV